MRRMNQMGMFLALFAMGGLAQGYASEGLFNVGIVQQNSRCTGVVKDTTGRQSLERLSL